LLVLDSGAVTRLVQRPANLAAFARSSLRKGLWPPIVPTAVLVECLTGTSGRDAGADRFLKRCTLIDRVPQQTARRAAHLRTRAGRGSAVDAIVVALAEPGGVVVTTDFNDLAALAAHADDVLVQRV
jgi:hypothetical protein